MKIDNLNDYEESERIAARIAAIKMITVKEYPWKIEVTAIDVCASLADKMMRKTNKRVSEETNTSVQHLLDMIELKRKLNKRVLTYLGYQRKVVYYRVG